MSSRRICLLVGTADSAADENAPILQQAFQASGWHVEQGLTDSLGLDAEQGVIARTTIAQRAIALDDHDLIWILGFGRRQGFLDKMQLLALVAAPFVTSPQALMLLHGKYALARNRHGIPHPHTWAGNDPTALTEIAQRAGPPLVLKPPAGSFGEHVTFVDTTTELHQQAAMVIERFGYALLQRRLPGNQGEYRVLIAGTKIIGGYRREPTCAGRAGNLAQGGRASSGLPDAATLTMIRERVIPWLQEQGVGYAGIDVIARQILEVNVINPGGLGTLMELGDPGAATRVVDAILDQAAAGP